MTTTRPLRSFSCYYICDDCNGHEFTDILPVIAASPCPCCDRDVEPQPGAVDLLEDVEIEEVA